VASRLLGVADASFLETTWPDIELLFRQIAMSGHAAEGRDLLDESGLGERWRPVREAMAAVAEGTWRYLLTLAAEVREPTRILLERFEVELADRPPEMD
jgi:hypothetical protein